MSISYWIEPPMSILFNENNLDKFCKKMPIRELEDVTLNKIVELPLQ